MPDTPTIYDAECLDVSALGFTCRIGSVRVFVGKYVPLAGTTIRVKGDRGQLTLPRWFAEQQGLALDHHLSDSDVEDWFARAAFAVQAAREYCATNPDDTAAQAKLHRAEDELSAAMVVRARRRRPR